MEKNCKKRSTTYAESNNQVTRLYSLKPIGLGTPYIECLTSYINRLAYEHCVFLGTIFNYELVPELNKQYLINYISTGGNGFYDRAYSINGNDKNAHDFMNVISKLTQRDDIWNINLISLEGLLSSRGVLKKHLSWCPICFDEWKRKKEPLYIPLLWNFNRVRVCTKHNSLLSNKCPNCLREMPIIHRKSIIGYCPYCNERLGDRHKPLDNTTETNLDWDKWVEINIGEILSLELVQRESLTREKITKLINALYSYFSCKKYDELAGVFKICKSTMRDWLKGITFPTFDVLLLISFGLDVKLLDILSDFQLDSKNISLNEFISKIKSVQENWPKRERINHNINSMEVLLHKHLEEEAAASISYISRELHCDKKMISNRFPQLYELLVKRHKEHVQEEKIARQKQIELAMEQAMYELIDSGIYPSRRKVEELLKSNIKIKEQFVKSIWNKNINMEV